MYEHDFPCFLDSKDGAMDHGHGLWYIKVHKTASTTMANVVENIAATHGDGETPCFNRRHHIPAYESRGLDNHVKNSPKSFLLSIVRDPSSRAISDYMYSSVTMKGKIGAQYIKGCCRNQFELQGLSGYQAGFMAPGEKLPEYTFWDPKSPEYIQNPKQLLAQLEGLFDKYDFIGASEKLNESLVILSFSLNLKLTDIAYQTFRNSANEYIQGGGLQNQNQCFKNVSKEVGVTPDVVEFMNSKEWKARSAGDKLLHEAVLKALDNTIDNVIGREKFQTRLDQFNKLQDSLAVCEKDCEVCSPEGEFRDMSTDQACSACNDRVLAAWNKKHSD